MIHPIPSGTRDVLPDETREVRAITDAQPPMKIAAGYFALWPTVSKEPLAATADAGAQMDIKMALDVEPELLDQAAGWQNRRVF